MVELAAIPNLVANIARAPSAENSTPNPIPNDPANDFTESINTFAKPNYVILFAISSIDF